MADTKTTVEGGSVILSNSTVSIAPMPPDTSKNDDPRLRCLKNAIDKTLGNLLKKSIT